MFEREELLVGFVEADGCGGAATCNDDENETLALPELNERKHIKCLPQQRLEPVLGL